MKTNPITAISDLLNKLVIEHGSAVIQEKHIALLKEQATILEKKTVSLESEIMTLKEENTELKTLNQNLRNENIDLKQKVQGYEKPDHASPLEDIQTKILLCISEDSRTAQEVSTSLNTGKEVIKFHLAELEARNMVKSEHVPMGVGDIWSLEQDGRKYLISNNLIS